LGSRALSVALAYGVSAGVALLRGDGDMPRIQALVDRSRAEPTGCAGRSSCCGAGAIARSTPALGQEWIPAAIVLLVLMMVAMYARVTWTCFRDLRRAARARLVLMLRLMAMMKPFGSARGQTPVEACSPPSPPRIVCI